MNARKTYLLTKTAWLFGTEVFKAIIAPALIAFIQVNTLSILMAIIEMRELAFAHQSKAISTRIVTWSDVFVTLPAFACVAIVLVYAFSSNVAVIKLWVKTFIDDAASFGFVVPGIVNRARTFWHSSNDTANFVELSLATIARQSAFFRWGSWSWHAHSSRT